MENRKRYLFILVFLSSLVAFSQKQINIVDINIVNLGDGQMYLYEGNDTVKPVNGKVRIINGVTTEYFDVEVKDGYPESKWEYYKNNKLKESLNFKNGYLDGKQYYYFAKGDLEYEASFKNGLKDGDWIYYNDRGGRRELKVYQDNNLVKTQTFYTNGNVDMERHFKNGREDGFTRKYTFEGELKS